MVVAASAQVVVVGDDEVACSHRRHRVRVAETRSEICGRGFLGLSFHHSVYSQQFAKKRALRSAKSLGGRSSLKVP